MTDEMQIPTYLKVLMKTTVSINGVYVPFSKCADILRRFIRPFSFYNAESEFELSFFGTCSLSNFSGSHYVLATKHQLDRAGRGPEEVCIAIHQDPENGRLLVSPSASSTISFGAGVDSKFNEDVLFLEFNPRRYRTKIEGSFLRLGELFDDLSRIKLDRVILFFSLGFPSKFVYYDVDGDNPEGSSLIGIRNGYCKVFLEFVANDTLENHIELRLHPSYQGTIEDFDGFSGAPVFFVFQDDFKQCHLGFAGMVRMAANERFHLYNANYLRFLLTGLRKPNQ